MDLIDEAIRDGEKKLQSYIDLTMDIDKKCLQFMGYMLTTGVVMVASACSIAVSGNAPVYGIIILSLGGISMLLGFCAGIRVISGDIAMSGIDPDDWIKAIDSGVSRESISRGRLKWLQDMISGSRSIAEQSAKKFTIIKKWSIYTTFSVIAISSIFISTDMSDSEVHFLDDLYQETPKLG